MSFKIINLAGKSYFILPLNINFFDVETKIPKRKGRKPKELS